MKRVFYVTIKVTKNDIIAQLAQAYEDRSNNNAMTFKQVKKVLLNCLNDKLCQEIANDIVRMDIEGSNCQSIESMDKHNLNYNKMLYGWLDAFDC